MSRRAKCGTDGQSKAIREYKQAIRDWGIQTEIRLRWLSIIEGLIRAAEGGDGVAFKLLREEAWGVPNSAVPQRVSHACPTVVQDSKSELMRCPKCDEALVCPRCGGASTVP
jgi:hypothetical protein